VGTMKTHRFRSLIWLAGCLGCAALADQATDSPTQAVIDSFPYQPELVARPTAPVVSTPIVNPEVAPAFREIAPDYRDYEALKAAMDADQQKKDDALIVRNLDWNEQFKALGKPSFQETVIPWSPMTTTSDLTFSPGSIDTATSKLQAHVPLISLYW
jgi:hypothetical protein